MRIKAVSLLVTFGLLAPLTVNADTVLIPTTVYDDGTLTVLSQDYLPSNAIVASASVNLSGYDLFLNADGTLPVGSVENASGGTVTDNYTVSLTGPSGQQIIAPQTFTDTVAGVSVYNYRIGAGYVSPDQVIATTFSLDPATVSVGSIDRYSGYDLTVTVNSLIYTTSSGQQFAATGLNSGPTGPGLASASVGGITDVSYSVPPVPLPAAEWLMLSGLGGLAAFSRKRKMKRGHLRSENARCDVL